MKLTSMPLPDGSPAKSPVQWMESWGDVGRRICKTLNEGHNVYQRSFYLESVSTAVGLVLKNSVSNTVVVFTMEQATEMANKGAI